MSSAEGSSAGVLLQAQPGGADLSFFLMMGAIFLIFYFLVIRPQQKRAKEHRNMLGAIKRGDQVITNGGIIGRVARIEGDGILLVEIAPNVKVKCQQSMIANLVSKSDPRPADNDDDNEKKDG